MAYDRTPLEPVELQTFLEEHPDWHVEGKVLERKYTFPTFLDGIAFLQRVAQAAEAANHHPDIDIRYRDITLRLTTHDAGGLTFRDPDLASYCDQLATVR
ncbi:MAG: 4a-hydroxytetrahydrobiopterin dehydratase [Myxococcaceae bacterium]